MNGSEHLQVRSAAVGRCEVAWITHMARAPTRNMFGNYRRMRHPALLNLAWTRSHGPSPFINPRLANPRPPGAKPPL
jgi:hypothetical protein